jgi:tRNA/rRNA methyltransferase
MTLERCRVVLVRPAIAGNVGAVARVMANFGLRHLVLVDPSVDVTDPHARQMATHGEAILTAARKVSDLAKAVAECGVVVATSSAIGGLFRSQAVTTPRQLMPQLARDLQRTEVALVFGPERTGLRTDEVTRCHFLLHIPSAPAYPVLNLAQAVAVCLYELYQAVTDERPPPAGEAATSATSLTMAVPTAAGRDADVASFELQERLYARWQEALEAIHFLWNEKAAAQMHAIRHVLGRSRPSTMEVQVLLGVARQILWYVEHKGPGGGSLKADPSP